MITLMAIQAGSPGEASFTYNWLSAFGSIGTRIGGQEGSGLVVQVLGNPVSGESAAVLIRGISGERVEVQLFDLQGRSVHQQVLGQVGIEERVVVPLGTSGGQLF